MTGFVIRRTTDNKYVSRPGMNESYTDNLALAWVFKTRDEAIKNLCLENEFIVRLSCDW
jgi:hypothetical protein